MAKKEMHWRKRQRIIKGLTITLVVMLGLGAIAGIGKVLNDKYDWVEKARDLFVKPDVSEDVEDEETSVVPDLSARHIEIQRAFEEAGKQVLTVVPVPANADIDMSFSVDKNAVVVTKTGLNKADVYVTDYFAGYATITATDAVSGLSATGKVYSYGKVDFGVWSDNYNGDMFDNKGTKLLITENNDYTLPTDQKWASTTTSELALGESSFRTGYPDSAPLLWVETNASIYIHMLYVGSYSPMIAVTQNEVDYTFYNTNDLVAKDHVYRGGLGEGNVLSIKVDLEPGLNYIAVHSRKHTSPGGDKSGATSYASFSSNTELMTGFRVFRGEEAQSVSFPDMTFYE